MKKFLKDKNFLNQLNDLKIKEQYIRFTILSWLEEPITEIQGKVLSGSINIDGSSSLRRTANLTMFADKNFNDLTTLNTDIAINKKVEIELGIVNSVPNSIVQTTSDSGIIQDSIINYQDLYSDIVWFPLGLYVIFNPSISYGADGVTISVSLQDKMCLLNGDAGGVIPASVTFHESEYIDENGNVVITHPTIYQIVEELVNHFGNEKLSNIIITDLDTTVKQVVKYIGTGQLYYIFGTPTKATGIQFFKTYDAALAAAQALGGNESNIIYYESNSDIGYIQTDFIYPGELTCSPGDKVTDVLDNIIKILGNYEYFYDIDGIFHFQEIKNYLNTSYTTNILNNLNQSPDYSVDFSQGMSVYTFDGAKLIFNISNSPNYTDIKNDFVIWGMRKGVDGTEYPIRYHLAIDTRPKVQGYDEQGEYYGIHENILLYLDEFNNWLATKSKDTSGITIYTRDYREELYYQGIEASYLGIDTSYYFTELSTEFPKIFDLSTQQFKKEVINNPSIMDFFLDIIDTGAEIGRYGVTSIGRRSEVIEENEINCIFERDIPDLVFLNIDELSPEELAQKKEKLDAQGQLYYQIDNSFASLLAIGGTLNSAYYRVTELLYQHTAMNNSISISTIPIYYLEPNTRITVHNDETGIFGDYVIQSISLPLDVGASMEISAYKAIERN